MKPELKPVNMTFLITFNVVYECVIEAPPTQEAHQSSVAPRLRGREEEEEDSGEEGRPQESVTHNNTEKLCSSSSWLVAYQVSNKTEYFESIKQLNMNFNL